MSGPVLSGLSNASYTALSAPVKLSPNLTLTDSSSLTMVSATVQIRAGTFVGDGDVLVTDTTGIAVTASYDSSTETLTLTGVDTFADYQHALQSVTFSSFNSNPTNFGNNGTRTITWTVNDGTSSTGPQNSALTISPLAPNPPPPAGTTADMILRGADASAAVAGHYEIYDIGHNSILAAYSLGQIATDWAFVTLGRFNGSDTSDMMLRNSGLGGTGAFEVYDISNNNNTNAAALGTVGLEWEAAGFADFNHDGMTDMLLRNSNTGAFEVYNISNNTIINAAALGTVGLNWQVGGFGNFSSRGESDMILRNTDTGGLEVYDINNNQITGAAFMGTVGTNWQISGVGNFSSMPGESDMLMRNTTTGGLEVYDIANNQIIGAAFLGTVGLDWQFAGVAPISGAGRSDLVLRNVNSGAFEVYNIANNQITGAAALGSVGLDWQLGGLAAGSAAGSMGGSTSQLVQAMAGIGGDGGAAESLNTTPAGADTSQQQFLVTPQ